MVEIVTVASRTYAFVALERTPTSVAAVDPVVFPDAHRAEDFDLDGIPGFVNTLTLSSGDAWIPGLFYGASAQAYDGVGRGDVLIQNALGVQDALAEYLAALHGPATPFAIADTDPSLDSRLQNLSARANGVIRAIAEPEIPSVGGADRLISARVGDRRLVGRAERGHRSRS